MKNQRILTIVIPVLLLATLLFSGCQAILVPKNGESQTNETETRQYDFSDFTRVDIGSAFKYEIKQSDTYSISITANSNLFDDISVTQEGQTLVIEKEFPGLPWAIFTFDSNIKVVITMPQLYGLDSSGATHGTVTGFSSSGEMDISVSGASTVKLAEISAGDISFDISGASRVTGDIEAENTEIEISGASSVQLKGSSGDVSAYVSGSSNLRLVDLKAGNASIKLSGASSGTVNLDGKLDVELSGSSTLEYAGEPAMGTVDITGASRLKKK